MSIRTTVTLDDDVVERVKQESRSRGTSFRETLNELIRAGALVSRSRKQTRRFRIEPTHMGLRAGLSYDDTEALIECGEGALHR